MKKLSRIAALIMALALILSLNAFSETKTVSLTYDDAYDILGEVPYADLSSLDFTFGPGIRVQAARGSLQDDSFNLYVFSGEDKSVTFTAPDGWAIQSISGIGSGAAYPTAVTVGNFTKNGDSWQWKDTTGNGMKQVVFKGAVTYAGQKITEGADINITNYYDTVNNKVVDIVLVPYTDPITGDTTMPALWFCLMLAGAASILVLRKRAVR